MNVRTLVWKEMRERPAALLTSTAAIFFGVAALVAIRHVTVHSEQEVVRQMESLGANILVLPKNATLADYYAADQNGQTLPEENAAEILLAGLTGVERLSLKMCVPATLNERQVTLTGILPQCDLEAKRAWQTVAMFSPKKHEGCKKAHIAPSPEDVLPVALASRRSIERLDKDQVVLGADIAKATALTAGQQASLLGRSFEVLAVLPATGTVDDSRVFAHLHTVQELTGAGEVVSAIEVMACCEDAAGDLGPQLGKLLPEARIVTISQVVQAQVGVNRLMANVSWFVFVVLALVGGASVAGAIAANVRERRREIGTLMALGATPTFVLRMFLMKALALGTLGGVAGCVVGLAIALLAGPRWAGVPVHPLLGLSVAAILIAAALALLAAVTPAWRAARLDPCACFQEV